MFGKVTAEKSGFAIHLGLKAWTQKFDKYYPKIGFRSLQFPHGFCSFSEFNYVSLTKCSNFTLLQNQAQNLRIFLKIATKLTLCLNIASKLHLHFVGKQIRKNSMKLFFTVRRGFFSPPLFFRPAVCVYRTSLLLHFTVAKVGERRKSSARDK